MSVDGEDAEEQNAANLFYDTLMDKAEIGEVAGDTYATFLDVLHLTPRFVAMMLRLVDKAHAITEDASMSTCTRNHSGYVERLMTTKFCTNR